MAAAIRAQGAADLDRVAKHLGPERVVALVAQHHCHRRLSASRCRAVTVGKRMSCEHARWVKTGRARGASYRAPSLIKSLSELPRSVFCALPPRHTTRPVSTADLPAVERAGGRRGDGGEEAGSGQGQGPWGEDGPPLMPVIKLTRGVSATRMCAWFIKSHSSIDSMMPHAGFLCKTPRPAPLSS